MRACFIQLLKFFGRRKAYLPAFAVVIFAGLLFIALPQFAHAGLWGLISDPSQWVSDRISELLLSISKTFFSAGLTMLEHMIAYQRKIVENTVVTETWKEFRNKSFDFAGIVIIGYALMNVLKIKVEEYGIGKMISRMLVVFTLVIFSKFICLSLINFANAISWTFKGDWEGNLFGSFDATTKGLLSVAPNEVPVANALLIFLVSVICFFLFLLLAAILFVRALFITFLLIISPMAFMILVLPLTEKFFKSWWSLFLKWVFFLPACILILSIGITLSAKIQDPVKLGPDLMSNLEKPDNGGKDFITQFSMVLIMFATLPMAVFFPLKLLGGVGGYFQGIMSGKHGIPGAPIDPKAIRDHWGARSKAISQRKAENLGAMAGRGRFGRFWNGRDRMGDIEQREKFAKAVSGSTLSGDLRKQYALTGRLGPNASKDDAAFVKNFERLGGNKDDFLKSMSNDGKLDHATATHPGVESRLAKFGDVNEQYKASNLHHLRDGGTYGAHKLSTEQLSKMNPEDIRKFSQASLRNINMDHANTIIKDKKMSDVHKRNFANELIMKGKAAEGNAIRRSL